MFFEPANGMRPAPLTHNPLNALICPRPIGWVSTVSPDGIPNLAPFSYFNAVSANPPFVVFAPNAASPDRLKDTYRNLQDVPEFVINLVDKSLVEEMNTTSASYGSDVDEFAECGLEAAACKIVRPPRVKRSRAVLECTVFEIVALPSGSDGRQSQVVIGEVVGIHIDDELIVDGKVDEARLDPVARLGYFNYAGLGPIFELRRPD
jgi:flavin reductase (DIM6/NTAB) family NADH-FMN oxidoreductase RutF